MTMRRRHRYDAVEDSADVALSPLIDCVFLLLIFFLVTSILKRKEKQVQVDLPDATASVAATTRAREIVIGLDAHGNLFRSDTTRNADGGYVWVQLADLAAFLKQQVDALGADALRIPIQINAHRDTPFQKAIDALDLCKLQGFDTVSVKTRQEAQQQAAGGP